MKILSRHGPVTLAIAATLLVSCDGIDPTGVTRRPDIEARLRPRFLTGASPVEGSLLLQAISFGPNAQEIDNSRCGKHYWLFETYRTASGLVSIVPPTDTAQKAREDKGACSWTIQPGTSVGAGSPSDHGYFIGGAVGAEVLDPSPGELLAGTAEADGVESVLLSMSALPETVFVWSMPYDGYYFWRWSVRNGSNQEVESISSPTFQRSGAELVGKKIVAIFIALGD